MRFRPKTQAWIGPGPRPDHRQGRPVDGQEKRKSCIRRLHESEGRRQDGYNSTGTTDTYLGSKKTL